uniref:Ribosomal protein S17 n=1 Tax=Pteridomonas sp. YPF1301 TaxID=2766739 RepID=A0A7G1MTX5_9STRA|nr:ribosomal protein S17 [Pteridomonas sp. YPF1301]
MLLKNKLGYVISTNMKKTIVVLLIESCKHVIYKKRIKRKRYVLVHDENNSCFIGDFIYIKKIKPLSKLKYYCLCQP